MTQSRTIRQAFATMLVALLMALGLSAQSAFAAQGDEASGTMVAGTITTQADDSDFVSFEDDLANRTGDSWDTAFRMNSEEDLIKFQEMINADSHGTYDNEAANYDNKYFRLLPGEEIRLSKEWIPLGYNYSQTNGNSYRFCGHFDGGGRTISNVHYSSAEATRIGFFGYVKSPKQGQAEILNVKIVGSKDDNAPNDFQYSGTSTTARTGGLIGLAQGLKDYSVIIRNCVIDANVYGLQQVGGLVGSINNYVIIEDCAVLGNVTSTSSTSAYQVGGIVGATGTAPSDIEQSHFKNMLFLGQVIVPESAASISIANQKNTYNALIGRIPFTAEEISASYLLNNHYVKQNDSYVKAYKFNISNVTNAQEPTEGMIVAVPTTKAEYNALVATMQWDANSIAAKSLPGANLVSQYNVTFFDEDGTTVLKEAAAYDENTPAADIVKPADPTKESSAGYSYAFAGWDPELADVTADATYKATYTKTPIEYSITYNLDNGTNAASNPSTYTVETEDITLADPTRDGYTFEGWTYEGQSTPAKNVVIAKGSTGNLTYTANWSESATQGGNTGDNTGGNTGGNAGSNSGASAGKIPDTGTNTGSNSNASANKSGAAAAGAGAKASTTQTSATKASAAKKVTVKKNKTYKVAGQSYKVTKVATAKAQGTVTFTKAKNAKKVVVPASVKLADGKTYKVTVVAKKAFNNLKKVQQVTIGKNVKSIKAQAFFKTTKLNKIIVKSNLLKKKASVKNALKGSKAKNLTVKVPAKMKKTYKKVFTKANLNAPKKVTVK